MRQNSDGHSTGADRVAGLNQSLRLIRQGRANGSTSPVTPTVRSLCAYWMS